MRCTGGTISVDRGRGEGEKKRLRDPSKTSVRAGGLLGLNGKKGKGIS